LLRSAAFRLVPMRLICDLMFAMFHFLGLSPRAGQLKEFCWDLDGDTHPYRVLMLPAQTQIRQPIKGL
jgi:hypothetical protein